MIMQSPGGHVFVSIWTLLKITDHSECLVWLATWLVWAEKLTQYTSPVSISGSPSPEIHGHLQLSLLTWSQAWAFMHRKYILFYSKLLAFIFPLYYSLHFIQIFFNVCRKLYYLYISLLKMYCRRLKTILPEEDFGSDSVENLRKDQELTRHWC